MWIRFTWVLALSPQVEQVLLLDTSFLLLIWSTHLSFSSIKVWIFSLYLLEGLQVPRSKFNTIFTHTIITVILIKIGVFISPLQVFYELLWRIIRRVQVSIHTLNGRGWLNIWILRWSAIIFLSLAKSKWFGDASVRGDWISGLSWDVIGA